MVAVQLTSAQTTQITLASDIWPPFTNKPGETAVASEIVKTALNRNSTAVKQRIARFDLVMKGIEEGAFQGSPALWKTEEREEKMIFSEPYLYNQLILVGRKGSDVSFENLNQVNGRIGLVTGYSYDLDLEESSEREWVMNENDQANLLALLKGEIDYMLVDALLIAYLKSYQAEDARTHLEIGDVPMGVYGLHLAIRKDVEGADELIEKFNESIAEMQSDGTYNRILRLNWISADVDGDGTMEMIPGKNAGSMPQSSYALLPGSASSGNVVYEGQNLSWEELPDDIKRTGINQADVEQVTFFSFGL